MVVNGQALLRNEPIIDMVGSKVRSHGVSHGLGEAGYDIRIKQQIEFSRHQKHVGEMRVGTANDNSQPVRLFGSGRFIIASAMEEFRMPPYLMGIVHDKSTWARQGLSVFNTVIEPGWGGFLTLELVYHGQDRLVIPAGAGIAQVIFHELAVPAAYDGKYQNQADEPVFAKNGLLCHVCGDPQIITPGGVTCPSGHGGAYGVDPNEE
jgi:dCTP deaminase